MLENILLSNDQNQKPTIGENCSKYFLLTLTVMLQKLKSSSLKKCKILLIHLKSNGIGWQLKIRALLMLSFAVPCTPNITDSSAITFVLEVEVVAKFHEICEHGVLHYFTFYCPYFRSLLCSHCIHFYYHKGWHFDSKNVVLKEVNKVGSFNLIMNDLRWRVTGIRLTMVKTVS